MGEQEPKCYVVVTTDDTVGAVIKYDEPEKNELVVVHFHEENGSKLRVKLRVKYVLDVYDIQQFYLQGW